MKISGCCARYSCNEVVPALLAPAIRKFGFLSATSSIRPHRRSNLLSRLSILAVRDAPFHIGENLAELVTGKTFEPIRDRGDDSETERLFAQIVHFRFRSVERERDRVAARQKQARWDDCFDVVCA